MCEVATAIAIASAVAGTYMQQRGQQQAQQQHVQAQEDQARTSLDQTRAQMGIASAERDRQEGIRRDAQAAASTATEGFAPQRVQQTAQAATGDRTAALEAATPAETGYLPGQSDGPQVVRDAVDRNRAENAEYGGQQGRAIADLGGWSDALFGAKAGARRASETTSALSSFGLGSARASKSELEGATRFMPPNADGSAGRRLRLAGDFTAAGGLLASPYADDAWSQVFRQGGAKAPVLTGRAAAL